MYCREYVHARDKWCDECGPLLYNADATGNRMDGHNANRRVPDRGEMFAANRKVTFKVSDKLCKGNVAIYVVTEFFCFAGKI